MNDKRKPTLVYIYCSGHSGSTLLNYLLNAHSQIIGLSEIDYIDRHIQDKKNYVANPIDGYFWQTVKNCYEQKIGLKFDDINVYSPTNEDDPEVFSRWALMNNTLLDCIYEVSNGKIMIDSSKRKKRLQLLQRTNHFNLKVIILTRNGLGVSNSIYQIYGNYLKAIWTWMQSYLVWLFDLQKNFKPEQILWLKYEDYAIDTEGELRRICKFLELDYEEDMLNYSKHDYVGIGGNQKFLNTKDTKINLDEKWRYQLPRKKQLFFNILGGWLNRWLGYK